MQYVVFMRTLLDAEQVRERLRIFLQPYPSQWEAAQVIGISATSLSQFLSGVVAEPQSAILLALGLEVMPRMYRTTQAPGKKRAR